MNDVLLENCIYVCRMMKYYLCLYFLFMRMCVVVVFVEGGKNDNSFLFLLIKFIYL